MSGDQQFETVLKALHGTFSGPLWTPGDEGYEPARAVWNAMIDRRPRLIAQCQGVADVIQAVTFATIVSMINKD